MGLSLPTFFGISNLATPTKQRWLLLTHIEARMKKKCLIFLRSWGCHTNGTHKSYSLVDVQTEMIPSPLVLDLHSSGFILV